MGGRFVSTPKIIGRKGDFALEEERLAYVELLEQKKAYLSFAMKRAIMGIDDALPSRFINEIPNESVEKMK